MPSPPSPRWGRRSAHPAAPRGRKSRAGTTTHPGGGWPRPGPTAVGGPPGAVGPTAGKAARLPKAPGQRLATAELLWSQQATATRPAGGNRGSGSGPPVLAALRRPGPAGRQLASPTTHGGGLGGRSLAAAGAGGPGRALRARSTQPGRRSSHRQPRQQWPRQRWPRQWWPRQKWQRSGSHQARGRQRARAAPKLSAWCGAGATAGPHPWGSPSGPASDRRVGGAGAQCRRRAGGCGGTAPQPDFAPDHLGGGQTQRCGPGGQAPGRHAGGHRPGTHPSAGPQPGAATGFAGE